MNEESPQELPSELSTSWTVVKSLKAGGQAWPLLLQSCTAPDERVVAKFLKPHADSTAVERMQREIRTLKEVDHPCVIKVLADGEIEGHPYYLMRAGTSFARWWNSKRGRLGPAQQFDLALESMRGAIGGLAELHRRGWIHRDLKPGNLIVLDGKLTIIDLGLIKVPSDIPITQVEGRDVGNRFMGQPRYSERPWTPRDDCRAVSWLLAWMLAKEPQQSYGAYDGRFHQFIDEPRTQVVRTLMIECGVDATCPKDASELLGRLDRDIERFGKPTGGSPETPWIEDILARQRSEPLRAREARAARLAAADVANYRIAPVLGELQDRLRARFEDFAARGMEFQGSWKPMPSPLLAAAENPREMSPVFALHFGGRLMKQFTITCNCYCRGEQQSDSLLPYFFEILINGAAYRDVEHIRLTFGLDGRCYCNKDWRQEEEVPNALEYLEKTVLDVVGCTENWVAKE
jgi:hypothetical protein